MDLRTMVIKEYSKFPQTPAVLVFHHPIIYCHILDIRSEEVLPLSRVALSVFLQLQATGQYSLCFLLAVNDGLTSHHNACYQPKAQIKKNVTWFTVAIRAYRFLFLVLNTVFRVRTELMNLSFLVRLCYFVLWHINHGLFYAKAVIAEEQ